MILVLPCQIGSVTVGITADFCHHHELYDAARSMVRRGSSNVINATRSPPDPHQIHKATFGAGCFWGVEAAFRKVPGVTGTAVGYMGGAPDHPTYHDVCTGSTGHAEVVQAAFDPGEVSYEQLLDVFWNIHDPTTPDRQGVDIGSQYRSVIFYHSPDQKVAAERSKEQVNCSGRFRRPVITEITPAQVFWRAEDYHQRYHEKHGGSGCGIG